MALVPDRIWTQFSEGLGATGLRLAGKWNVPIYRASRGRLMGRVGRAPVLLLTTTGRKSGQPRTAPVLYLDDDGRFIVIGSNAGNTKAPAWAHNLEANPDAEIQAGRRKGRVRARIAQGDERAELWRKMNDQYAGFDHYAGRTTRDIRVFVLEPAG
ncbi:MAG TPA: nitroreductase family deazaflavin-dependent oxidoreductase [Solirubrobacteraceae bacterium]|nr:nitroreductase family deazaflavin-dependent oxidoreductase [Solirubrobacteraceae bacterium]